MAERFRHGQEGEYKRSSPGHAPNTLPRIKYGTGSEGEGTSDSVGTHRPDRYSFLVPHFLTVFSTLARLETC